MSDIKQELIKIVHEKWEADDEVGLYKDVVDFFKEKFLQREAELREAIEDLPAFTPVDRGCCSKVSDEAKKPMYGTNYLERETVLVLLNESKLLESDNQPKHE